jgi:hypothetical protein
VIRLEQGVIDIEKKLRKQKRKRKRKEVILKPVIFYVSRVNYFLHFKNSQDLKVLGFFVKLYPRVSGLVATPDPIVMFIILIITLNLG